MMGQEHGREGESSKHLNLEGQRREGREGEEETADPRHGGEGDQKCQRRGCHGCVPAQEGMFALILWYVEKTLY